MYMLGLILCPLGGRTLKHQMLLTLNSFSLKNPRNILERSTEGGFLSSALPPQVQQEEIYKQLEQTQHVNTCILLPRWTMPSIPLRENQEGPTRQ